MDTDKVERLRERLLVCPICMDEYRDPRLLPCHHSVCLECISNMLRTATISQRVFRCPQCRADVCVPRGGIRDLPINFYILSLQDELGTGSQTGLCDICQRQWLAAQFRCEDCHKDICRFCIHEHRLFTHEERVLNIRRLESVSPPSLSVTSQCTCAEHVEELLQLFCASCNAPVCISCACGPHKRHRTLPLAARLRQARGELQREFDRLSGERQRVLTAQQQLTEGAVQQRRSADTALQEIEARAERLHRLVEDQAARQRASLTANQKQNSALHGGQQEIGAYLEKVDKALGFLEDLQDGDMCLELLEFYSLFRHKLDNSCRNLRSRVVTVTETRFVPGKEYQSGGYVLAHFGRVKSRTVPLPLLQEQEGGRGCWAWLRRGLAYGLRGLLAPGGLVLAGGLGGVAWGMTTLFGAIRHAPDQESCTAFLLALLLLSILAVASIFAYRKA